MLLRLRCLYHMRRPRVATEADISFVNYRKALRQARREVHVEAVRYQQQIEDQYLEEHKEAIRKQHFQNQCSFRKQIFTDAFRLYENHLSWGKQDQKFSSALNKHLHDEDVRRINRSRILKIMEHESSHYWFSHDNVDTRLQEESIFPEFVASSEYYFKLFAEALAYELGNFQELHLLSSSEEIIKEKNKYLIPLYLTLRNQIAAYRRDEVKALTEKHSFELNLVRNNSALSAAEAQQIEAKLNEGLQEKLREVAERKAGEGQAVLLRRKIEDLVAIFNTWKEYTNILALTSAQVIRNQEDAKSELQIQRTEKEVLKSIKVKKSETFVDSIEEDTEELEVTFEEYLAKINQDRKEKQVSPSGSIGMEDLDALISTAQSGLDFQVDSLSAEAARQPDLSSILSFGDSQPAGETGWQAEGREQINPVFLNPKETTSSVQILKQQFGADPEMLKVLNQLGEIDVRYPKLFQEIWRSSNHNNN